MSPDAIAWLNRLDEATLRSELGRCCGASRWVDAMVVARPFASEDDLFAKASRAWWSLAKRDWLEAFAHHPRIGDAKATAAPQATRAWAASEQAGASRSSDDVKAELRAINEAYEAKFGHVYLVCATGKTGEEMLAIAKSRIGNDPESELRIAAGEQEKITRIRLEKMSP